MALEQIRGGVQLRPVTPPLERTPVEEKVVDVQSELRQMIQKKRKQEVSRNMHILLEASHYSGSIIARSDRS